MSIKKHREGTYYVNKCISCGSDFEVAKDSTTETCYKCQTEEAILRSKEKLAFFIDAKIINIEPEVMGHLTASDEIESIEVETTDGKRILFRVGGYDEHYIEWDEERKN